MATENQQITAGQRLEHVLAALRNAIADIEPFLDIPFDKFLATVRQALVNSPDILKCTPASIIRACIKAAHDGLRIDGREAALVKHGVKVSKQPERWEDRAEYFPMVFGIVQQILKGGEVIAMESEVVREGDEFEVMRGTNPGIHHRPNYEGERGQIIAAYSVATLKSGVKTFEVMDRADLAAVKAAAKTKYVWDAWPGEMSRKSVVRRHRKMLPLGDRDIVDSEERSMFEDIEQPAAGIGHNSRPRPTRESVAQAQDTSAGMLMDASCDVDGVVIDQERPKEKVARQAAKASSGKSSQGATAPGQADMPADASEWQQWASGVDREIVDAPDAVAVNTIAQREEGRLKAAPKQHADYLRGLIADRLTDFATEGQEA